MEVLYHILGHILWGGGHGYWKKNAAGSRSESLWSRVTARQSEEHWRMPQRNSDGLKGIFRAIVLVLGGICNCSIGAGTSTSMCMCDFSDNCG